MNRTTVTNHSWTPKLLLIAAIGVGSLSLLVPSLLAHQWSEDLTGQHHARVLSCLYTVAQQKGLSFEAARDSGSAVRAFLSSRKLLAERGLALPELSPAEAEAAARHLCIRSGGLQVMSHSSVP